MKTFKFPKSENKVEICIFCIFLPLCYLLTLLKAGTMLVWFFIFLQCESKTFTKKTFLRRWTEKNWTQLSLEGYRRYHYSCDNDLFQISHQFFNTSTIIITMTIINKIFILVLLLIIIKFLVIIVITLLLLIIIFMIISSWCFLRRGWQTGNRYLNIRNLSARA